MSKTSNLQLVDFSISADDSQSKAAVTVSRHNGRVNGEAASEGVFEAMFKAIDDAIDIQGDRTALRIHAFSDYAPRTSARMRVRFEEREYSGRGASADPLEAAAIAYLTALSSYLAS